MKTALTACLIGASLFAAPSIAEDVTVAPGLWSYQASATLGPIPLTEAGSECVDQTEASMSLNDLIRKMNAACSVTRQNAIDGGYSFDVSCSGGPDGTMSGTLLVTDVNLVLDATGYAGAPGNELPVAISGQATRVADSCGF